MMTRKQILNLVSLKKRDAMAPASFPDEGVLTYGPQFVAAPGAFLWCPTFRQLARNPGAGSAYLPVMAGRTSTTCFIKLVKERVRIEVPSNIGEGSPQLAQLQWRRIVWFQKGPPCYDPDTGDPLVTSAYTSKIDNEEDGNEDQYNRLVNRLSPHQTNALFQQIFQGQSDAILPTAPDWTDPMTAYLNRRNFKFVQDKTMTFNPANGNFVFAQKRFTYNINKNLQYFDAEYGAETGPNQNTAAYPGFSTLGRPGCGDMYILDIFRSPTLITDSSPGEGDTVAQPGTTSFIFTPEAEIFWHEK